MSRPSTNERLLRLRGRPPERSLAREQAGQDTGALEKLEATLLGRAAEGTPLKERLERLVKATAREPRRPPRPRTAALYEAEGELVQGQRVENARGEFYRFEADTPLESFHGDVSLSRLSNLAPGVVAVLEGKAELNDFDLSRAAFLDTETTGLAGGAGTAAFLIGVGSVEGDRFRVRQYFMRDYHEETALLQGLAEDLQRFERIVTFNGKMFDVPLLEGRFRLNRLPFPLEDLPHFDLLHPARRLWKARLESCRLQDLEVSVLGLRRQGDVPGALIPGLYFDYLRTRDARELHRVFEHNRIDIVSLAALAVLACQWVHEGRAEHPLDVFSLARVLQRAQLHERSESAYRRAAASRDPGVRGRALLELASRAKRARRHDEAVELWHSAAEAGQWWALRELAVHHEHRTRDLRSALAHTSEAVARLSAEGVRNSRALQDLQKRRQRLQRKLSAKGPAQQ